MEDVSIDVRLRIELILRKQNGKMWLKIGTSSRVL